MSDKYTLRRDAQHKVNGVGTHRGSVEQADGARGEAKAHGVPLQDDGAAVAPLVQQGLERVPQLVILCVRHQENLEESLGE